MCWMCTMTDRWWCSSAQKDESFALKKGARYENQDAQKKQTMDGFGRGDNHSTGTEMQIFMIKR